MLKRSLAIGFAVFLLVLSFSTTGVLANDPDIALIRQAITDSGADWVAGETSKSSLSDAEKLCLLGARAQDDLDYILAHPEARFNEELDAAPSVYDWRNAGGKNYTTPIKDQGDCNSCIAFAVNATLESGKEILQNSPNLSPDLSEAQLYFCNNRSCKGDDSGWYFPAALDYVETVGAVDEACFPYRDYDFPCQSGRCADWQQRVTKIANWRWIGSTTEAKQYIANRGPLMANFEVFSDFYYYTGGVYRHSWGSSQGYHAVSIVGYNDAGRYWIAKNSWGTDWGENGWFKIAYGDSTIDNYFWVADLSSNVTGPRIKSVTTSATQIYESGCPDPTRVTIQATITDIVAISWVKLHYRRPGSSSSQVINMQKNGNTYRATLGPYGSTGYLFYYVETSNARGETNQTGWKNVKVVECTGDDPPVIAGIQESADPINQNGCPNPTKVKIQANVTSGSALSWVRLYYQPPGVSTWRYTLMQKTSGSKYAKTLGPCGRAGTLKYYIKARDTAGRESTSSTLTVQVNACESGDPPAITNIRESADPIKKNGCTEPTKVTIQASVSANSALSWVRLYYQPPGISTWRYANMRKTSGTNYSMTLGPCGRAGTLRYYVKARDAAGRERTSSTSTVTVNTCSGNTPPTISNIRESADPIKKNGCSGTTKVTVTANVTDSSGLSWVRLYYLPPGVSTWRNVVLRKSTGNNYRITLGPCGRSGQLKYYVKARDLTGLESKSNTFSVTVQDCGTPLGMRQEAESAEIVYPMVIVNDGSASGGKYVHTPTTKYGGEAIFKFTVPSSGNYTIWARVWGIGWGSDSFWVSVDGGNDSLWPIPHGTWTWAQVSHYDGNATRPVIYNLAAGTHELRIRTREHGSRLDIIEIRSLSLSQESE